MTSLLTFFALLMGQVFPFPGPGRAAVGGGGCSTPTGSSFTESFGDASTSCWTSGPSTCNHTWGTFNDGFSIATSPGTPPSNSACTNSLQFTTPSSDAGVYFAQSLPAATPSDVFVYVYVPSFAPVVGADVFVCISGAYYCGGGERASLRWRTSDGPLMIRGSGSTTADVTVSAAAWHKVQLHMESGANASYVSVDNGTNATFTQAANDGAYITIYHSTASYTMSLGALWVN